MIGRAVLAGLLLGAAAPPPPGASSCSGCHGGTGPVPTLAGRDAGGIVAALAAFRSGEKPGTVMGRIAKGFTPAESEAIATWWAAQK
jgi:cytochrome subunit of sulfide dehydrogenase